MASTLIPVDRLPDIVLGRDPEYARPEAFAVLAASDLPEREHLLATVLEQAGERPDIRTSAAVALGRIATPESERVLLAGLDEQVPRVLEEIARSLGRIGSKASLKALNELARASDGRLAWAARFGATLLAHRLQLPGHELPMPAESQLLAPPTGAATRPIEFEPQPPEARAPILADLARFPLPGIEYDENSITAISCAGAELALALNREVTAAADYVFERKSLAGVVALQSPETGEYSVSLIALTAPADGGANLQLTTNSGSIALAGQATEAGGTTEFTLRAVSRPGALAMSIVGTLDGGRLTVTEAVSGTVRERSRVPQGRASASG